MAQVTEAYEGWADAYTNYAVTDDHALSTVTEVGKRLDDLDEAEDKLEKKPFVYGLRRICGERPCEGHQGHGLL